MFKTNVWNRGQFPFFSSASKKICSDYYKQYKTYKLKPYIWVATAGSILAACGGGDGGRLAIVLPPPTNQAPLVSIKPQSASIEEGQSTTLDASDSSDPDGDTLTFSWAQMSGPSVEISTDNQAIIDIIAPEIIQDEIGTFQLSVSDGVNTETASIDVNFSNIFQTPRANFEKRELPSTTFPNGVRFVDKVKAHKDRFEFPVSKFVAVPDNATNGTSEKLVALGVDTDTGLLLQKEVSNIAVPTNAQISSGGAGNSISPSTQLEHAYNFIAEESQNQISVFDIGRVFEGELGSFDIDQPCHASETISPFAYDSTLPDKYQVSPIFVAVGIREGGLKIVAPTFSAPQYPTGNRQVLGVDTLQSLGTDESFCFVKYQFFFSNPFGAGSESVFRGIFFAVDYDAQTVSLLLDKTSKSLTTSTPGEPQLSITPAYEIVQTLPLQTNSDNQLDIVGIVDDYASRGFYVLMTDGNHIGEHRAIYINLGTYDPGTDDASLTQTTLSWDRGVPQNGTISEFFLGGPKSLIINTRTSPEAVVFDIPRVGSAPLEQASYLEIGLKADDVAGINLPNVIPTINGAGTDQGILVTYPETNEIKLLVTE